MRVELIVAPALTMVVSMQSPQSPDIARAFQQAQTAQQQAQTAQQQAAQTAQAAARAAAQAGRDAAAEGARAAAEAQRAAADAQREAIRAAVRGQIEAARAAARQGRAEIAFPQFPGPPGPQIPEGAVIISVAFFLMCAVIAIGYPLVRAIARRMDKRGAVSTSADPDIRNRLERIEQAVDAIAVEVERISEGQRFTTKVIADLRALPQGDPAAVVGERAAERSAVPLPRAREAR